jgi:tetratricopeptide (TPR) repeat protein
VGWRGEQYRGLVNDRLVRGNEQVNKGWLSGQMFQYPLGGTQKIRGDGLFAMNPFAHFRHFKNTNSVALLAVATFVVAFGATGCAKLKARDDLNKGVAAYRDGKYDQSIEFFKQAKDLDPTLTNARLYLATAYATQYIPGAPSDENIRMGGAAVKEFQDVLSADPNNISAIDGIGSILYNMAGTPYTRERFEESKTYHMKHIALKPEDPEPYYWIGVIDWTLTYRANLEMRGKWRLAHLTAKTLKDDDPMPPEVREDYSKENGQLIDEGITNLRKAVELRPDYDDAMAYLNLLLRRKADEAATPDERASLLKEADDLVDKAKEIKQKKMEAPAKS